MPNTVETQRTPSLSGDDSLCVHNCCRELQERAAPASDREGGARNRGQTLRSLLVGGK